MSVKEAFVGAEGYGSDAIGGRGGQIVHVTNLNDAGEGSLRWALEQVRGPRTVVFDVNGTITLKTQVLIEHGNVTIAGQTAPGGGIVIEGSRLRIDASEVIVRGLHFRPGDGNVGMAPDDRDGMFIGSTDNIVRNVIVDHNSFSWSVDQNIGASGRVENLTISNNIIAQGLSESIHSKGEHSKGAGTGPWTTGDWKANNHISFIKNLMADNSTRNPEIGSGDAIEMINNYIFNPGRGQYATWLGGSSDNKLSLRADLIGNVFEAGLDTQAKTIAPVYLSGLGTDSRLYFEDNLVVGRATDGRGNMDQKLSYWSALGTTKYVVGSRTAGSDTEILDASDVAAYVLANVGAGGAYRDEVDARIIAGVANKTSRIVDSVAEAGGPAKNPAVRAATDTDKDGMPDWFEDLYGFAGTVADDKGDKDGDGYTNVEEYLNAFYTGFDLVAAKKVTAQGLGSGTSRTLTLGTDALDTARVVSGFNSAAGDRLDLSALTGSAGKAEVAVVADRTFVSVDQDGAGAGAAKLVAILDGVRLTDVAAVVKDASSSTGGATGTTSSGGGGSTGSGSGVQSGYIPELGITLPKGVTYSNGMGYAIVSYILNPKIADVTLSGEWSLNLTGHAGNNRLFGNVGANILKGEGGDDQLFGAAGNDQLLGGAGQDALSGGDGNDKLDGGDGDDLLVDDQGNDELKGGAGADQLSSGDGNDRLDGGAGVDRAAGGAGDDLYFVDDSRDTIVELAGEGVDLVNSSATFTLAEEVEHLTLTGTAAVDATGNSYANKLTGNAAANRISGLDGDDKITGGAGDDQLSGGAGADQLDGGIGNDRLRGGEGADYLAGGTGADVFTFARGDSAAGAMDRLVDFRRSEGDKVDLEPDVAAAEFASVWLGTNNYALVSAKAKAMMAGGAYDAVFVAGASDGWLFVNCDANATTFEDVVWLKGTGSTTLAAFNSAPGLDYGCII